MESQINQNQLVTPYLEVKQQSADYKSMFAAQDLKVNTIIANFSFERKLSKPDRYSVQINETEHILLSPTYLRYINHSCTPNVFFDTTNMELRTLKSIKAGEELLSFIHLQNGK